MNILKKFLYISASPASFIVCLNSSVLSNTLYNSPDLTGQNTKSDQQIAQAKTTDLGSSGVWTGNFTCGQTDVPVSVQFHQVPRDSSNINVLADISPNPPTGENPMTLRGAFDPESLNMTLTAFIGNQIWAISGHFKALRDAELLTFTTDRGTPCSLALSSQFNERMHSPMLVPIPSTSPAPDSAQPAIPEPTQSSTSQSDRPHAPEPTQPPTSSSTSNPTLPGSTNQIDLTGDWIESASVVTIDNKGCTLADGGNLIVDGQDPQHRVFTLRQSGNQLTFPTVETAWQSGSGTQSYQGSVSGNRVTYIISGNAGGGFTAQSTGTISDNGNRVSGEGICRGNSGSATANVTFTWVRQVTSQSNVSLVGTWQSDWGPVVFNSNLTGYWNQGGGTGQIQSGTYDPQSRRLVFRYYQPWNDMNGTTTLTLSQDGNQLSGTWTQQRGSNPVGSGGSGTWTMRRPPSQ